MVWSSHLASFGLSTPRHQAFDFSVYIPLDGIGQIQIPAFANAKPQYFSKPVGSRIIQSENKRYKIANYLSNDCLNTWHQSTSCKVELCSDT